MHCRPPFDRVRNGDLVLIKASGGPVVAVAEVANVWFYELTQDSRDFIRSRFGDQLCADPEFWESKTDACFATLMRFSRVERIEPIDCWKRDRRGWLRNLSKGSGQHGRMLSGQSFGDHRDSIPSRTRSWVIEELVQCNLRELEASMRAVYKSPSPAQISGPASGGAVTTLKHIFRDALLGRSFLPDFPFQEII